MNKYIRTIEIITVAIITDCFFLLSCITGVWGFLILLILLPFLCSFLFYMIIQSPSSKEKLAFTLFRLIVLFALARFFDTRYLGGEEGIFLSYALSIIFLDAVISVLIFYLIGWWMRRKQFSLSLGIRGKRVVTILLACFIIIAIPISLKNYWHYFDGSWSGTYEAWYGNDRYEVVLDQHRFCYNDVVEADFKVRDGKIVLDMDSIRIKENSSDIYTDSQKQQMLDEIISLAENNDIRLTDENYEVWFYYDFTDFTIFDRVVDGLIVHVNTDDTHYHYDMHCAGSESESITLGLAREQGMEPCRKCVP